MQHFIFKQSWFKNQETNIIVFTMILIMVPLVYLFVYQTGGIKYVYSHTMYIPILLAGILFGPFYGLIVAVLGGILLGPLMPIEVLTEEPQLLFNWVYRLIIFMLMGSISGFASFYLKSLNDKNKHLLSHHAHSGIANINFLVDYVDDMEDQRYYIASLLIHNSTQIYEVLGSRNYNHLLRKIETVLKQSIDDLLVIQSTQNKLWLIKPFENHLNDTKLIVELLNQIKQINNIALYIDYTLGIDHVDDKTAFSYEQTFQSADLASKIAKNNDKDFVIYEKEDMDLHRSFEIVSSFQKALNEKQTYLVFQPKIDLNTLEPVGAEVLLRWVHPKLGLISPAEFVPIIEDTKLIHQLSKWVFDETLKVIKVFKKAGLTIPLSINVSTNNLMQEDFASYIIEHLHQAKIDHALIGIEITEHVLVKNSEVVRNVLTKLHQNDIKVSVDDFGTGYSSLSYLNTFHIDRIKLDRSFISKLPDDEAMATIIKSTIDLAKTLGYQVVAEGIETKEQLDVLKAYQCCFAQGYYFAKPMKQNDLIKWYQSDKKF